MVTCAHLPWGMGQERVGTGPLPAQASHRMGAGGLGEGELEITCNVPQAQPAACQVREFLRGVPEAKGKEIWMDGTRKNKCLVRTSASPLSP